MLKITVRPANDDEKLNIDSEAEETDADIVVFDSTEWSSHFLCGLTEGDWVVEIDDPEVHLNWQTAGLFHVQMGDDGGFYRKIV